MSFSWSFTGVNLYFRVIYFRVNGRIHLPKATFSVSQT